MEYIDGAKTLAQLIANDQESLTIARLDDLLRQGLSALRAVHAAPSRWHRDVKPANILVANMTGGGDILKLIDFGILHDPDSPMTTAGTRPGTIGYKAPELYIMMPPRYIIGEADYRADLFALGVSFFYAACGEHPYPKAAESETGAIEAFNDPHLRVPLPSDLRPEISPTLERVIMGLIEPNVTKRFQTADAALTALGAPSFVPAPHAAEPRSSRVKFMPMAAAFVGGLAIAGSVTAMMMHQPDNLPVAAVEITQPLAVTTPVVAKPAQTPKPQATRTVKNDVPKGKQRGQFDLRLLMPPTQEP